MINNSFVVLTRRQPTCSLQGGTSRNVRLRVVNPAPRNAAATQPGITSTERDLPGPSSQDNDTPASSLTHVQPEQQLSESQQQKPLPLLLSGLETPAQTISLPLHPAPGSLQIWQTHQNNPLFYPARLFGNAEHPDIFVGLGAHELLCHSQWAASRLQQASTDSASMHLVLPVRTEQETVRKLVQALYSRVLLLAGDAEQVRLIPFR